ncbi:hypothetical protein [Nostoc sp. 'Peltigera membranacea cyanobiont' 210A]|uniref:hypothetical protein n=1 Tax=Nostoc sp. 'Peltigera membranacea cyanobiont' 210A TaxID=2014529 RepID=UPI00167CA149|nr:hypothetical protein [Nostoc sp. 'Peltigera membranacea cyanobiont' 210A]
MSELWNGEDEGAGEAGEAGEEKLLIIAQYPVPSPQYPVPSPQYPVPNTQREICQEHKRTIILLTNPLL